MLGDFLQTAYVAIVVVLLFCASIFVHEYGHYAMALLRRMRVLAFAIGFGPKIFSWRDRRGVEWSVRWIPAGGFVKLPQMITSEAIEGRSDGEAPPASPWSRILVALSGPAMNVLFAFLLAGVVWYAGLPVLVNPSLVGPVQPGSAAALAGVRAGDLVVAIGDQAVATWQDIGMEVVTATTNVLPVTLEREGRRFTVQLPAKRSETLGLKWLDLEPQERPVIGLLQPGLPAEKAGLRVGDKLFAFAGVPVLNERHLMDLIGRSQGRECVVEIEREGRRSEVRVTPFYDAEAKRGRIGIGFSGGHYRIQRPGPDPLEQVGGVLRTMGKTVQAIADTGRTGVGLKDLSGPAGILPSLAVQVKTDFRLALGFMVMLNINLALLNLLPLPVLDGGHIVMALYELVLRRRVSVRFQEYATAVFAVLLVSFMAYVTFHDYRRAPLFWQLFRSRTVVEQPAEPGPGRAP